MILDFLKRIGKLEPFEIKNSSFVLVLMSLGTYLYSELIYRFNKDLIEFAPSLRIVFVLSFMLIGLMPLLKKKIINDYYGILVFLVLFSFQFLLTYSTIYYNFSLDFLLGSFILAFGSILMMNNRILIIIFSAFQLLHMGHGVLTSNLSIVTESAILTASITIFLYSFIIMNGFIRYRKKLLEINATLEDRIQLRTQDMENRAKELYERNKDLEEFAYVVSHDLKRPLRNIHTLTDWLTEDRKEEFDKTEMKESLFMMKDQVEQMDLLINGILNYSLQINKEYDFRKLNVDALVRKIAKLNSSEDCVIEVEGELPVLMFNESQLIQVFQNLIQNGIKHNDKETIHIKIGCKEENEEYIFYVNDNGPGIEDKYHDKIFQLFQKLEIKDNIESIGIGLALVKKIIERNGEKIWIESKVGAGTTFFFTIKKQ